MDMMCAVGSADTTDSVLSSISQSTLTTTIRQSAYPLGTHEYSQCYGWSQEAQTNILNISDNIRVMVIV